MQKPTITQRVILVFRHLFVFRKPVLEEFDFIDLVIGEKALFLLTWKIKGGYKLKVHKTHSAFWSSESAVVLLLKKQILSVDVSISNFWRKRQFSIGLKQAHFDDETAAYLLKQIRSVNKNGEVIWNTPLSAISVQPTSVSIHLSTPILRNTPTSIQVPIPSIKKKTIIYSEKLKYQP